MTRTIEMTINVKKKKTSKQPVTHLHQQTNTV